MIYSATQLIPNNIQIDATVANTFTWVFNGEYQTAYQVKIYKNSDNSLIHDSGKITFPYDYHIIGENILTNGNTYKFKVETWEGNNSAISNWSIFHCYADPTLTIGDLPTSNQTFEFQAFYSQTQNVPLKTYRFYLYLASDTENPLSDSGDLYPDALIINNTVPIKHTFDGLLNDTEYAVKATCINQFGKLAETGLHTFTVNYTYPTPLPNLVVVSDSELGTVKLDWTGLVQVLPTIHGTYSYVTGKYGYGLKLDQGSYIEYTETIPKDFSANFWLKISDGFTGDILKIGTDGMRIFFTGTKFGFQLENITTVGQNRSTMGGLVPSETLVPSLTLVPSEAGSDLYDNFFLIVIKHGILMVTINSETETISI